MACPNWTVSYAGCGPSDAAEALDEADRATFEGMAVDYLWNWTGQAFGVCPVLIRPCRLACVEAGSTFWGRGPYPSGIGAPWQPVQIGGKWFNLSCGVCGSTCSCGVETPALVLPGPVESVTTVTVDTVELVAGTDYLVDGNRLIRLGGAGWPICQDVNAPLTETGTWGVEYEQGTPVPVGGQIAAGVLALELSKAACRDQTCALPQRLQSITRQGVTIAVIDSFDDIDKGHTGIWIIDSWIASVTKPKQGGRVYSVDKRSPGRMAAVPPPAPPVP